MTGAVNPALTMNPTSTSYNRVEEEGDETEGDISAPATTICSTINAILSWNSTDLFLEQWQALFTSSCLFLQQEESDTIC